MTDLLELDLAGLRNSYAMRQSNPVKVVEAYLSAIAAKDAALRSYITVAGDAARIEAEASRRRWAENRPLGLLDGVPISIKDNIDVAGLPCTAGTAAFRARIPQQDAPVVTDLRRRGAVILGKLNLHEGAFGATTDNPVYGRCMNPVRPGHTPGGSSGGSAAAVAARLCAAALGTDTMGSVRLPAAYCGVYGFKPSNAAVSTEGVVPLSPTLDSVGVLTRSAASMVIMAEALLRRTTGAVRVTRKPAGLRVGVPRQLAEIDLAPAVASAFDRFLDRLRDAGMIVSPLDLPTWHPGKARRAGLLVTEVEAAAYYIQQLGADLTGLSSGFAAALRYPIQAGPSRIAAAYEAIEAVRLDCRRAFAGVELIAMPTAPQTSFSHDDVTPTNQADCTALANFVRGPAMTLPFARHPLPIGMQLMAAPGADDLLFDIAVPMEEALHGD